MAIQPLLPGTGLYETRAAPGYRFEVQRLLGQGGFGITYLCRDLELDGVCVVKEFALGEIASRTTAGDTIVALAGREGDFAAWLDRFEREARQIHRISHPNVVRVRAAWRERGTAYYAMDLVEGANELPSPDENGWRPMRWADVEPIARGMLSALGEVHAQGLIHGDIKPSNVLLDRSRRPVLIDFGTARSASDLQRTVTSAMYTPGFAPPELTSRKEVRQAGPWSDLYSWAMVVWGLVANHNGLDGRPLDAASRIAVAQSGGADRYTSGSAALMAAGVPAPWAAALVACLQIDVDKRPASVDAVEAMVRGGAWGATVVEAPQPAPAAQPVVAPPSMPTPTPKPAPARQGGTTSAALEDDGALESVKPWYKRHARAAIALLAIVGAVVLVALALPGSQEASVASPLAAAAPAVAPDPSGMVRIRAGSFTMGSPLSESGRGSDEVQRTVTLTRNFWLGATEVTQSEYQSLMGTNPSNFTSCGGNCPVEQVSWLDAVLYANARSRSEGLPACYDARGNVVGGATIYDCAGYRLPTEAEWEYAARAGTTEAAYGALGSVAWYLDNAAGTTHPVRGKAANAWGLYDMLGNVWEWTNDCHGPYDTSSTTNPLGADSSSYRVFRGCSWLSIAQLCRAADRHDVGPSDRYNSIGFRLARTAP